MKNIVYDALKPFDEFIKAGDSQLWRDSWGTLRTFKWSELLNQFRLLRPKKVLETAQQ